MARPQQPPTCINTHVRTPADAHLIFHAVHENILPMVVRRLDVLERRDIRSGHVFVWQERESNTTGIERWTDGRRWGPSRTKDDFLFYNEKDIVISRSDSDPSELGESASMIRSRGRPRGAPRLVKQTYSAFVETRRGRRKWHMIAYTSEDSLSGLKSVHDFPALARLRVPQGVYTRARLAKGRSRPHAARSPQHLDDRIHHGHASPFPVLRERVVWPGSPSSSVSSTTDNEVCENTHWPVRTTRSLPPLSFLENVPPAHARRHPYDERALMAFR